MTCLRNDIVEIKFASIICECVIINTISDSFVEDRERFNGHPTAVGLIDFSKLHQ